MVPSCTQQSISNFSIFPLLALHVVVPLPDIDGRKEILEMYAKKTKLAKDVDLNVLARGTTGFSGAELFNLMNQMTREVLC
jgi:ATP-dependent Zn protease